MSPIPSCDDDPSPILPLDRLVIDRIAAGEIIQTPANCIKEMVENAIDAKATTIQITVKDGGLKCINVQDNGIGIRKDDLSLICQRWTTSKLSKFEDLQSMSTYGFRGEALSSISHISHLTILSMTSHAPCAYKSCYRDGMMIPDKGQTQLIIPCAGTRGTQITVEDLFYNYPLRKKSFSPSEEYSRILDVVSKYAIHNHSICFTLKRMGDLRSDLCTKSETHPLDTIRTIYGSSLVQNLQSFFNSDSKINNLNPNLNDFDPNLVDDLNDNRETLSFEYQGLTSIWSSKNIKKTTLILFVNHRLVESPRLKRLIKSHYQTILSKSSVSFWCYLSIQVDPKSIDINIHPNKSQVQLENEEEIYSRLVQIMFKYINQVDSRPINPIEPEFNPLTNDSIIEKSLEIHEKNIEIIEKSEKNENEINSFSNYLIDLHSSPLKSDQTHHSIPWLINRSDSKTRKMTNFWTNLETHPNDHELPFQPDYQCKKQQHITNSFETQPDENDQLSFDNFQNQFSNKNPSKSNHFQSFSNQSIPNISKPTPYTPNSRPNKRTSPQLLSIQELLEECQSSSNIDLIHLFKDMTFVGCATNLLTLIQHQTNLYLLNIRNISEELFYQEILHQIGEMKPMNLGELAPISPLIIDALKCPESKYDPVDGSAHDISTMVEQHLISKKDLLEDYYAMKIGEDGTLMTLPEIIKGYVPAIEERERLAMFLLRMYTETDWIEEKETLERIARELAALYAFPSDKHRKNHKGQIIGEGGDEEDVDPNIARIIEYKILPSLRYRFYPSQELANNKSITLVAKLESLYKLFERC